MPHYVYMLTDRKHRLLYVGMASNIQRRTQEHNKAEKLGFAARYNIDKLVYIEELPCAKTAAAREKQLKSWRRVKKINLLEKENPAWEELTFAQTKASLLSVQLAYSAPLDKDPSTALGINSKYPGTPVK